MRIEPIYLNVEDASDMGYQLGKLIERIAKEAEETDEELREDIKKLEEDLERAEKELEEEKKNHKRTWTKLQEAESVILSLRNFEVRRDDEGDLVEPGSLEEAPVEEPKEEEPS